MPGSRSITTWPNARCAAGDRTEDPLSGNLFVFKNWTGDKLKILAWMGDGFALYLRRLERGTFGFPKATEASISVTPTQLAMILGGLDPAKTRERLCYKTSA